MSADVSVYLGTSCDPLLSDTRDNQETGTDSNGRKVSWYKYQWTHGWVVHTPCRVATRALTFFWAIFKAPLLLLSTPITVWWKKEISEETHNPEKGIGSVAVAVRPPSKTHGTGKGVVSGTFSSDRLAYRTASTLKREDSEELFSGFPYCATVLPASDMRTRDEIGRLGYHFGKRLGKGSQGEVYEVVGPDRKTYALKMISAEKAVHKQAYVISEERGECLAISFPKHENLMQTEGIFTYNKETGAYRYVTDLGSCSRDEVVIGLLMECVPDSQELFDYAVSGGPRKKKAVRNIGQQIARGIVEMHGEGFLHRDLKLENVLIDKKGNIKIVDFGFARYLPTKSDRTFTACGTPNYAAPELIEGVGYGESVDAWSFGIVLYTLAFGGFPIHDDHVPSLLQKIVNFVKYDDVDRLLTRNETYLSGSPLLHDRQFRDLLGQLLCHRDQRISMEEVLRHPFFA
ncbi:serine/threonine-protein kinase [Simkania sp.]|uniref:serine/threonine-protein kinase n=1 Tax=Simkania sp. TaxID=34094 RepID=UPI003B528EB2